jgi:hypothetical protein
MPNSQHAPDSAHGPHDAPLTKASRRLLRLSLGTPRPCPWGPNCICLTLPEQRTLRRVGRIVRQWRHRARCRERMLARAHPAGARHSEG